MKDQGGNEKQASNMEDKSDFLIHTRLLMDTSSLVLWTLPSVSHSKPSAITLSTALQCYTSFGTTECNV